MRTWVLAIACVFSAAWGPVWSQDITVERRALHPTCSLRVHSFTEKAEAIACPVAQLPLVRVVEDGAWVEKGQTVAEFDRSSCEFELGGLERQRDVVMANLAQRLLEIENNESQMKDRLAGLRDRLAVSEARLTRLRGLPLADDVLVAEGRLRIARMNAEAAKAELDKARGRLERGLISQAELEVFDRDWRERQALLAYAETDLALTRRPAKPALLRQTELEMANLQLECDKIGHELQEYRALADIQRTGAVQRRDMIERQIAEKQEDIRNTVVTAPMSGYVTYGRLDDQEVAVGVKMWKNYTFLRIPDLSTLAFRGVIPESVRKFFAEGDPVQVRVRGRQEEALRGTVKAISTLSHDLAEKEEAGWGGGHEFGVKVFDVTVELTARPAWLRPGMLGTAEIGAGRPVTGPAVPLTYVRSEEGRYYLALGGAYRPVKGTVCDGHLLLEDESLCGVAVAPRGTFPEAGGEGEEQGLYSASGELLPVQSLEVTTEDVGNWPWPKVTWLIPEETPVAKGDVVVKLDAQETERSITREESLVSEARSALEEQTKQVDLARRDGAFRVQTEQNLLEIVRLQTQTVLDDLEELSLAAARLTCAQARLRLEGVVTRLEREKGRTVATLAPAQLERLERDRRRQELRVDEADLRLTKLEAGSEPVTRSQARLALVEAEVRAATVARTVEYERGSAELGLQQAEAHVRRHDRRLRKLEEQKASLTLRSPGSGIICYGRVWNSGAFSKVSAGVVVGPRFTILSIPDLSQMVVSVEVPERYYSQVQVGMPVNVRIPALSNQRLAGRVTGIDFLLENRQKKDSAVGLYSSHEPLGDVIFKVRVEVKAEGMQLKPGLVGEVVFPFKRG